MADLPDSSPASRLVRRAVALSAASFAILGGCLTLPGTLLPLLVERFARERDILGGLVHPHIARLYDAGIADDGQPYMALEYVQGTSLTAYCDQHRLGTAQRLALAMQVIGAVQRQTSKASLVMSACLFVGAVISRQIGVLRIKSGAISRILN